MFDAKVFLDQLLTSGKELAQKSQDFAESRLGIPESGPERDRILAGLGQLHLGTEGECWLQSELRNPATPAERSKQVSSPTVAAELYLASSMLLDDSVPVDRAYLDQLASALQMDSGLVQQLQNSSS